MDLKSCFRRVCQFPVDIVHEVERKVRSIVLCNMIKIFNTSVNNENGLAAEFIADKYSKEY